MFRPVYQLIYYTPSGEMVAIIDDYRSFQFGHTVNGVGYFTLQMSYHNPNREIFETNGILEAKRKIHGYVDWYTEFVGLCEDFSPTFFGNGNTQFSVVGQEKIGLISRPVIAYEEGSSYAAKDAPSETVMKEYVAENIGALATTLNGRIANFNMSNFYVAPDGANGITWTGDRSGKNLLATLQDIANYSDIDFDVIVHPELGIGYWLFETYVGQTGLDRTTIGLDPTTGLNAAGNEPHIFSAKRGNVDVIRLQTKHKSEINRCYIFGQDPVTGLSLLRYRENTDAIGTNYINLREAMRGGGSQDTADQMDALSDEYLEENKTIENFDITVIDSSSSLYGVHFNVGDRVTALVDETEYHKRLVRVSITVSGSGAGESNKEFEFADIP